MSVDPNERETLLPPPSNNDNRSGEYFDPVPQARRRLTTTSAIFIVFNRIIGTGIYATPAFVFRSAGSVGLALVMWLLGAAVAAAGTAVYVELGTGLPRSGGEKNYLEFMYPRPRYLTTCIFVVYAIITGSASANSVVFGQYTIHALSFTPTASLTRLVALGVLTTVFLIHASSVKWGVRLQNTLGGFKLIVLLGIGLAGIGCAFGWVPLYRGGTVYEPSQNFESWEAVWKGSSGGLNAFGNGLYSVIWSFTGYSSANYALSEVKSPINTLKRALPLAVGAVSIVYLAVNTAYFAVVSRDDMLRQGGDGKIIAALYFRNLFGPHVEKALSAFIALSTFGNLLAGQFGQGRVIQELGREGIVPYSSFFASSWPFGTPAAALLTQYTFNAMFMLLPPPGDVYLFMINVSSYSMALINTLVSAGLLALTLAGPRKTNKTPIAIRVTITVTSDNDNQSVERQGAYESEQDQDPLVVDSHLKETLQWDPPIKAPSSIILLFFLSNVFLVGVPLVRPTGNGPYEAMKYWAHPLASLSLSLIGTMYWFVYFRHSDQLERRSVCGQDGIVRWVFGAVR